MTLGMLIPCIVAAFALPAVLAVTWRRLRGLAVSRRAVLVGLRGVGILCLVVMLANPVARTRRAVTQPPRIVVLIDNSTSMALEDAPGGRCRYDWARDAAGDGNLLRSLPGSADVLRLACAETVVPLASIGGEAPVGPRTNIDAALRAAARSSPLGAPDGALLISDGATNAGPEPDETLTWLRRAHMPVHCIGVGDTERPPDAWIARVDAPRSVRAGTIATVSAVVASRGLNGTSGRLNVSGPGVASQERTLALAEGSRQRVAFRIRSDRPGLYRYRISLGKLPGEWTDTNNGRSFCLRVTPGESKLLLVSGRPGPELKFLRRALEGLGDVRTTCLVRKASGGFGDPARPAGSGGLPTGRALDAYDAVVLQDVEASALSPAGVQSLAEFVSRRGGGLGVLGGASSFRAGWYAAGSLAPALGVRVGEASSYSTVPIKVRKAPGVPDLAPAGDIERHEHFPGWPSMPLVAGLNEVPATRPGASVLLQTDAGKPLLVIQRYGQGRSLCLLTGGTYRWQLSRDASDASRRGHTAFWQVIARWLTTPPNRAPVALETDRDAYETGSAARLSVYVTDIGFQPVSGARVVVSLQAGAGPTREVPLTEVAGTPGRYEAGVTLAGPGAQRLTASASLRGSSLGTDAREIMVETPSLELASPAQDVAFLRSIAEVSGGTYVPAEQASQLPAMAGLAPKTREVWVHSPWSRGVPAFLMLLALLGLDWFLRRWWGVG